MTQRSFYDGDEVGKSLSKHSRIDLCDGDVCMGPVLPRAGKPTNKLLGKERVPR